ncbi:MAG: copper resistance D family protein [Actinomycetota bacterium]
MGFEETFRSVTLTLTRTISFSAHLFLFGLVPLLLLVLRPSFAGLSGEEWVAARKRTARRLEGMVQAALTATALATLVALVIQFALVSEVDGGEIGSRSIFSVLETRFGSMYLLRFPLLAGLSVLLVGRVRIWAMSGTEPGETSPGRGWWIGWAGLAAGLLATNSFSGHAGVGEPIALSISNDLLHLACAATWFTGIVILALVLPDAWRGRAEAERVRLLAPAVVRFSSVALVTITILGITGVLNAYLHVGRLADLFDTNYGRSISLKILVYLGILAVGGINHFFVRKRLEEALAEDRGDPSQRLFRRTIAVELVMALGILGITGFLTGEGRTRVQEAPASNEGVTARQRP